MEDKGLACKKLDRTLTKKHTILRESVAACLDGIDVVLVDFDALSGGDGVEVVEVKVGNMALEQRRAQQKLAFDVLGVSSVD